MSGYQTICVVLFALFIFSCKQNEENKTNAVAAGNPAAFSLLSTEETNIDFSNTLTEGLNTNILMYEYFYNGGGVAAEDLNNDGFVDLYFTSNMGDNKIYLNKGNFQFEDISLLCGAQGRPGPWKTGVSIVDINADGLQDIYLCHSGSLPDEKRKNELFINKGNNTRGIPVFQEQASVFGLDHPGFSTQSYFFDYDRDNDLDMILLNHNPKNLPMLNEQSTKELMSQNDPLRGTRLFKNNGNKFDDITVLAGVNGSPLSYGLGLGISDINNDGWPDFYVSNDYNVPDYLYINNKNGGFTDELHTRIDHTSQFSMGNEIADINNDGLTDIITLDMLPEDNRRQKLLLMPDNHNKFDLNVRSGFYYQYMRNMLHLNQSNGHMMEIGQYAGISNTDWSWSALLTDFNNDGIKDLHITNGYKKDYTNLDFINYMDSYVQEKGRLRREDAMKILEQMPASNISNYIFSGSDSIRFSDMTSKWGLKRPSNSNGAIYADLDNDGDQDVVVNNINQPAFIYKNNFSGNFLQIKLKGHAQNINGIGSKIKIITGHQTQISEQYAQRGYQSSISSVLHFGLGKSKNIQLLEIIWPDGKMQSIENIAGNQKLMLEYTNATSNKMDLLQPSKPIFKEISSNIQIPISNESIIDFDRQLLLPAQLSHNGPAIISRDMNKDGFIDLVYSGDRGHYPAVYIQQKNKSYKKIDLKTNDIESFVGAKAAVLDIEKDGDLDIIIPAAGFHDFKANDPRLVDKVFVNNGNNRFMLSEDKLPVMNTSKSKIIPVDLNGDGYDDLFVASRCIAGQYPLVPGSYFLLNDGNGKFIDKTQSILSTTSNLGMITDAVVMDINSDNKSDLAIVGEWMPIQILIQENNKMIDKSTDYVSNPISGWWNVIFTEDFNNDQKPDFILGNHGENSQFKSSTDEPIKITYTDFDKNGSIDPIISTFIQNKSYPYVSRDELLKQLAYLKPKYNTFEKYADATLQTIFTEKDLEKAKTSSITELKSCMYLSTDKKMYEMQVLPKEVQYAPIHCIQSLDFNKDGNKDLLLTGNNSNFKIRIGQIDANHGVLLENQGNGKFKYITQDRSGLDLKGDIKSSVQLDEHAILFGINGKQSVVYRIIQ